MGIELPELRRKSSDVDDVHFPVEVSYGSGAVSDSDVFFAVQLGDC